MSFVHRNPLILLATIIVAFGLGFVFNKSATTQSVKNQKKDRSKELVTAVRNGGLREAARLNKDYVTTERTSGWAKYDLENLTINSSTVVVGTPLLSTPKLSESGERILTDHQVRVEQVLKGNLKPNQVVTLTVVGGKLNFEDGTTAEVRTPDQGPIETGKTYVLFLNVLNENESKKSTNFSLTGGGQGLFEIASDATIEPRGDKVDTVQKHKHSQVTAFIEEIKATVKKHPATSRCCN